MFVYLAHYIILFYLNNMSSTDTLEIPAVIITPGSFLSDALFRFDFGDNLRIGTAEFTDSSHKSYTGCTIFYFPNNQKLKNKAVVDIKGPSASTFNTSSKLLRGDASLDCIIFTGGSRMGLPNVVSGVSDYIMKKKLKSSERLHTTNMPSVSGAAIYDYAFRKDNLFPTYDCGLKSIQFCEKDCIPIGEHGAGSNSHVGKIIDLKYSQKGGQSAYFTEMPNGIKIFVCVVLNSAGAIYDENGKLLRGNYDSETKKFIYSKSDIVNEETIDIEDVTAQNTTLTFVCTNQVLTSSELAELSSCVHTNMARYISPFATSLDGDVLYMVSTMERDGKMSYDEKMDFMLKINETIKNAIHYQFK